MSRLAGLAATFERELRAYFLSPMAYLIMAFLLAANGVVFALILSFLNDPLAPPGRPLDLFFGGTLFFWLVVVFTAPVVTMRLFSEELRSGSIEVLLTAPVGETQVVLGKYFAALVFWVVLWLPTVAYAVVVSVYSPLDWGVVAAGYLGIFLIGALFLAVGTFASALTSSQIVAAVVSFALLVVLFGASLVEYLVQSEELREIFGYLSIPRHMEELARGIVDTRRPAFYLTTAAFFLFLTTRVLAVRTGRSR